MANVIEKDGVYRDADGNQFRFRKGHVVAEGAEYTRVADFPDAEPDVTAERNAKAAPEPANKAEPAPANKKA